MEIIPAIIAENYEELEQTAQRLEPFVSRVSLDVMDGVFVEKKTISGYEELRKLNSKLIFDVHLMVQKPQEVLDEWLATSVDRIFLHQESTDDLEVSFGKIRNAGKKTGLVLNPHTELSLEYIDDIDYIQFMTVEPGAYGGKFIASVIPKISEFHERYPDIPIAVDGGVTPETAAELKKAGASILISGSYIINSDDIAKAINDLQNA